MARKLLLVTLAVLFPVVVGAILTAPPPLTLQAGKISLPEDIGAFLANREAAVDNNFGLIPGTEKRIRWHADEPGQKTPYSIVYLHGFSATRQETAPVSEIIADAIGANMFETRLTGHGRERMALENVTAEDWLSDAAEALAVGARLGSRIVVIGTSTGATLAMAMARHPLSARVTSYVMISPNFAPLDRSAEFLTFPGGPQLARIVVGSHYRWQARNELQAKFWTTDYPMASVVEMMRLVQFTRAQLPMTLEQRVLTIMSPADTVVSPQETKAALQKITAPGKELIEFVASVDEGQHVLAGDILSPESNAAIASHIINFLSAHESR